MNEGIETYFGKSFMDEMTQQVTEDIMKQRDEFLINQIEKFAGEFEHEWELKAFIAKNCRIERHPHDVCKLFVNNFQVIQWRERIVNEFDFETGKATIRLVWNQ